MRNNLNIFVKGQKVWYTGGIMIEEPNGHLKFHIDPLLCTVERNYSFGDKDIDDEYLEIWKLRYELNGEKNKLVIGHYKEMIPVYEEE